MRRSSSTIPYGYKLNEENPEVVEPVEKELEALEEIVPLVKDRQLSLADGAMYLEAMTERSISPWGLNKLIRKRYA
tara:strand:+ start:2966 stop:3193 length:228 start_codon:yes stop_codon:yes gene_type:complete